ncbi:MAG: outer membrane lipoprotein-sorting protein [Verrucomicrobia bacterium]|nr:outer membrane lipoprotein-sorting protein [Verrucomicrobiota bacterium]
MNYSRHFLNRFSSHLCGLCGLVVKRFLSVFSLLFSLILVSSAADMSPKELAAAVAAKQEGTAYVRLRLQVKPSGNAADETLQLQVKERRTKTATDLVYQILWPQAQKGESVLLHQEAGHLASGSLFTPPDKAQTLAASQLRQPFFGSDLSYLDVIEDPLSWENQTITGTEVVNGVNCTILESKPNKGESEYAKVRSWIDPNRLVQMRIEKYSPSGEVKVRIETSRVANDDKGRPIPANLIVQTPQKGSVTELDGSRIKHNVTFSDAEFTPEGLKQVSAPTTAAE